MRFKACPTEEESVLKCGPVTRDSDGNGGGSDWRRWRRHRKRHLTGRFYPWVKNNTVARIETGSRKLKPLLSPDLLSPSDPGAAAGLRALQAAGARAALQVREGERARAGERAAGESARAGERAVGERARAGAGCRLRKAAAWGRLRCGLQARQQAGGPAAGRRRAGQACVSFQRSSRGRMEEEAVSSLRVSTDEAGSHNVLSQNDSESKFTIKLNIPRYTAVMDDGSRKFNENSDHVLEVIADVGAG
ncbi:hypothetical protein EJB05_13779, partial [Eragrostis curvula]